MKPSSVGFVAGALASLCACTPDHRETIIGRWHSDAEQLEFREDGTFQANTPRGSDSGRYRVEGSRLLLVPGGIPELERTDTFRVSWGNWTLRLCEMNQPKRCTEYDSMERESR